MSSYTDVSSYMSDADRTDPDTDFSDDSEAAGAVAAVGTALAVSPDAPRVSALLDPTTLRTRGTVRAGVALFKAEPPVVVDYDAVSATLKTLGKTAEWFDACVYGCLGAEAARLGVDTRVYQHRRFGVDGVQEAGRAAFRARNATVTDVRAIDDYVALAARNYTVVWHPERAGANQRPAGYCLLPQRLASNLALSCEPTCEIFTQQTGNKTLLTLYTLRDVAHNASMLSVAHWDTYAPTVERADQYRARVGADAGGVACVCNRCTDGERVFDDLVLDSLRCLACKRVDGVLVGPHVTVESLDSPPEHKKKKKKKKRSTAWRCTDCNHRVKRGYVEALLADKAQIYETLLSMSQLGMHVLTATLAKEAIGGMRAVLTPSNVVLYRTLALYAREVLRVMDMTHQYDYWAASGVAAARDAIVMAAGAVSPWSFEMCMLYRTLHRLCTAVVGLSSMRSHRAELDALLEQTGAATRCILALVSTDSVDNDADNPPALLASSPRTAIAPFTGYI